MPTWGRPDGDRMMPNQSIARRAFLTLTAGGAIVLAARPSLADDTIAPEARGAVTRMAKTLATGAFSFKATTIRQYEKDNVPLHIVHAMALTVHRPDHLRVDINGDDGQSEIGYDGKTLTIYNVTGK